jgi:FAD/FMN-containing dehydrogenase
MPSAVDIEEVAALAESVEGPVLVAEDPDYEREVQGFNTRTRHHPLVAVGATCPGDVAAAVRWARERGLAVGVHATGHGATSPLDGGVLVCTRRMQGVAIDPVAATATIEAGVQWASVIAAAAPWGLAPLNGSSSLVGAVGYVLGGGMPVMGRTFGFAADHVRSFELVGADGELRHVSAESHPDLFWALRGGKANIGIVTSMVVGLVPVATLFGGGIFYPGEAASDVLHAYRRWTPTLSDSTSSSIALLRLPPLPFIPEPLRGRFVVHLRVAHVGSTAEGEQVVAPMRAVAAPIMDYLGEMPYTQVDSIHQDPHDPLPFRECGLQLDELTPEAVDAVLSVAGPGADCPLLMVELRHLGGALARVPEGMTAVGARSAGYLVFFLGVLMPPIADAVPGALLAAEAELAPYTNGHTFVNMHGEPTSSEDRARPWTNETCARLRRIKAEADPTNLFRFAHTLDQGSGG